MPSACASIAYATVALAAHWQRWQRRGKAFLTAWQRRRELGGSGGGGVSTPAASSLAGAAAAWRQSSIGGDGIINNQLKALAAMASEMATMRAKMTTMKTKAMVAAAAAWRQLGSSLAAAWRQLGSSLAVAEAAAQVAGSAMVVLAVRQKRCEHHGRALGTVWWRRWERGGSGGGGISTPPAWRLAAAAAAWCQRGVGSGGTINNQLEALSATALEMTTMTACRRPSRYVPYIRTFVPYDGTYGAPD